MELQSNMADGGSIGLMFKTVTKLALSTAALRNLRTFFGPNFKWLAEIKSPNWKVESSSTLLIVITIRSIYEHMYKNTNSRFFLIC